MMCSSTTRSSPRTVRESSPTRARTSADVSSASFFFFQAEDGIRDLTVTGVQTCALPISPFGLVLDRLGFVLGSAGEALVLRRATDKLLALAPLILCMGLVTALWIKFPEIGRASCRERV